MPKSNFLFFLNAYGDLLPTAVPALNQFKWSREINGVPYTLENSQQIQVAASSTSPNIVPYSFSTPTNSGNATLDSTNVIVLSGSSTGIESGQLIVGGGIDPGTTVLSLVGSSLTMSKPATAGGLASLSFYKAASFVYLESDKAVSMIYNNGSPMALNPFQINGKTVPGVFFMNGPVYSMTITNDNDSTANIFFVSMG